MRDVVTVLQRAEMVRRIAEEIEGYVIELGADGRLVHAPARGAHGRRRGRPPPRRQGLLHVDAPTASSSDVMHRARRARRPRTCSTSATVAGGAAPRRATSTSTARCSRAATGCCTRSRACPSWSSDHVVDRFAQPAEDHARQHRRPRRGRGRRRGAGPRDQGGPVPPRRDLDPRALRLDRLARGDAAPEGCSTGRRRATSRSRVPTAPPIDADPRPPRRHARRRASCCTPTSWAAAAVRRPVPPARDARLRGRARPSRSPARRPRRGRRRRRRRAWARVASSTTTLQLGDLEAAADYLVVARRRRARSRCSASAWAACTR